jgi:DNA-binding PadR family transcriptional regulator
LRTLKYAILGLVNRNPITGYDITKEFNKELANFWYAKHSQIYPELKKLVDEGLINFEVIIAGESLEKKLYTITEKGKESLKKWLLQVEDLDPTPKDKFKLRMYFSEILNKEEIILQFEDQLIKRNKKLQFLNDVMNEYDRTIPDVISPEFGDYMVLEGAILREQSYIEWINRCLNRLK